MTPLRGDPVMRPKDTLFFIDSFALLILHFTLTPLFLFVNEGFEMIAVNHFLVDGAVPA